MTRSTATAASSVEHECLRAAGLVVLGVGVVGVLLWAASFPGWPLAAGITVSVLVLAGLIMIWGAEPVPAARWLRPAGLVAALVLAIGGAIVIETSGDVILRARFERSRVPFDQTVAAAGPISHDVADQWLPYPGDCPTRIGSYRIAECHAFAGGFMYLQERGALGDDAGFAYAPDGLRPGGNGLPSNGFTPIDGPWYAWSCDC